MTNSDIEESTKTVETLTTTLAKAIIESETECLSFGSAKMRYRMFGNTCLLMHEYYPTKPWLIIKLWLSHTAALYPDTMTHCEYQVLPNTILPPTALGDFYAIIYFANQPSSTPGIGSLHILRAPVDYAQPGYAEEVYGTTNPGLISNRCREYRTVSCLDEHTYTCLQFYTDSAGSREIEYWNHMLLTSATIILPLKEAITV